MNEDGVQATVGPGPGGTGTTSVRSYNFFLDGAIQAAGGYADNAHDFEDPDGTNFVSHSIMLINESGADIWFSFNGTDDHGRVAAGEPLSQDFRHHKKVWFRGTVGSTFRFWAW